MSYTEIVLWSTYVVWSYVLFPLWVRYMASYYKERLSDEGVVVFTGLWLVSPIILPLSIIVFSVWECPKIEFGGGIVWFGRFLFLAREERS